MKAVRIFLLILIILGLGLLATTRYWVPNVVRLIVAHDTAPLVVPVSTTTKPIIMPPKPYPAPAPSTHSGIDITVTIGPTCPVAHSPELPECADKPYETTLILASTITGKNGGVVIRTDVNGRYSQDLGPGTYTIRAQSSNTPPTLAPTSFEVKENSRTVLHLMFDSGIR